jgi:nitroreductase
MIFDKIKPILSKYLRKNRSVYNLLVALGFVTYDTQKYYKFDEDRLGAIMRKHAHYLDKDSRFLYGRKKFRGHVYVLEETLNAWEKNFDKSDPTYKWCKQVLYAYKNGNSLNREWKKAMFYLDFINLVKSRRSVRKWKNTSVSKDVIFKLIDAARWAPSSCNRQTWKFLVLLDEDDIINVGTQAPGGAPFFTNAKAIIIVLIDKRVYTKNEKYAPYQDGAAAIQNILLAAHTLGLGACWGGWGEHENEQKILEKFNIPVYYKITGMIALGYPDEYPLHPARRKLEDIIILKE